MQKTIKKIIVPITILILYYVILSFLFYDRVLINMFAQEKGTEISASELFGKVKDFEIDGQVVTALSDDPRLVVRVEDAKRYICLNIDSIERNGIYEDKAEIFWANIGEAFDYGRSKKFDLNLGINIIELPTSDYEQLRIDLTSHTGVKVGVDSLLLYNKKPIQHLEKFWTFYFTLIIITFIVYKLFIYYKRVLATKTPAIYDKRRVCIFLGLIFILFLRAPELIIKGRFWAEEGTLYFKYAWEHNILQSIVFVYFRCGYYYLSANLSAIISTFVPLEFSAMISTWIAFGITILVIGVVYFVPSHLLKSEFCKVLFCLDLIVGSQIVAEVYCNNINTQVYWGIMGVIILFSNLNKWYNEHDYLKIRLINLVLLIASFSGLYCVILFPFFVLRYLLEKNKQSLTHVKVMAAPFLIQLGIVVYSKFFGGLASSKLNTESFNIKNLFYSLRYQFVTPIIGYSASRKISWLAVAMLIACILIMWGVVLWINRTDRLLVLELVALLTLFAYYFAYVQIGALGGVAGGRYAVVSGSIIYLLILICVEKLCAINQKKALKVFLALALVPILIGGYDWQGNSNSGRLDFKNNPNWKQEVQMRKTDNTYKLQVWPAGWGSVYLED